MYTTNHDAEINTHTHTLHLDSKACLTLHHLCSLSRCAECEYRAFYNKKQKKNKKTGSRRHTRVSWHILQTVSLKRVRVQMPNLHVCA